jgi:hypothetical protein
MANNILTLGSILAVVIVLYICYIVFLRDEGFVVSAAETKASDDKSAAAIAKAAAAAARATSLTSSALALAAQKEVERLQKVADRAPPSDKVTAQSAVTAAAAIASTKVTTAATDRTTAITTAMDSATAAEKYYASATVVAVASKKTSDDAEVAKSAAIRANRIAVKNASDAAAAVAAPPNPPLAATVLAKSDADAAATAAAALVTTTTTAATAAAAQVLVDQAAADAAATASQVAVKFLEDARKNTNTNRNKNDRVKNNPTVTRNLGKQGGSNKPEKPGKSEPSPNEGGSFLTSALGGFLGAGIGSLIVNSMDDKNYRNRNKRESTRGGPSPNRNYSDDYDYITEYNQYEKDCMRRRNRNVETCNLQSVDCDE